MLAPHTVARKGVVRTFQETTIFRSMTVRENIIVAHHLRSRASLLGFFLGTGLAQADEAWLVQFGPVQVAATAWAAKYRARMDGEGDRSLAMNAVNPKYILRNWVAETAIRAVENRGDVATLDRILTMLQAPFDEQPGNDEFAAPPPPDLCGLEVSCSS